jgi:hypothetical protein
MQNLPILLHLVPSFFSTQLSNFCKDYSCLTIVDYQFRPNDCDFGVSLLSSCILNSVVILISEAGGVPFLYSIFMASRFIMNKAHLRYLTPQLWMGSLLSFAFENRLSSSWRIHFFNFQFFSQTTFSSLISNIFILACCFNVRSVFILLLRFSLL